MTGCDNAQLTGSAIAMASARAALLCTTGCARPAAATSSSTTTTPTPPTRPPSPASTGPPGTWPTAAFRWPRRRPTATDVRSQSWAARRSPCTPGSTGGTATAVSSRAGSTNGDFHPFNLLYRGDAPAAIVDWDRLGVQPRAEEAVRAAAIFFVRPTGALDLAKAAAYTREYDGSGMPSRAERGASRVP